MSGYKHGGEKKMVAKVITVRGEIEPKELGFCQTHEHLYISGGSASKIYPALLIDDPEKSLVDAVAYIDAGGCSVVDALPVFAGRSATILKQISEKSGVHVIASTGFHRLMWYSEGSRLFQLDEEALTEIYTREIEEGMVDEEFYSGSFEYTDIRAGQIKTALESDFTYIYKKMFNAAAKTSLKTGVPIMIHVEKGSDPLMLLRFLTDLGIAPEKQIYCHLDRAIPDIDIHKELIREGAYLEYDTIVRPKYRSHESEVELILEMLDMGLEDRVLISLDTTRTRLRGYGGVPGLDYLIKKFIPELKERGVSGDVIDKIFIKNPAALYAVLRTRGAQ